MKKTFRKIFTDRNALQHEQQVLEYLGQRLAPVPIIISCNFNECALEMKYEGIDLYKWLKNSNPTAADTRLVLSQALEALLIIAELDVWHLDIACRNFLVKDQGVEGFEVLLIDFTNSVSSRFPLKKPLWMRPSNTQHRALRTALVEDWRKFFSKNKLVTPDSWTEPFQVPMDKYNDEWGRGYSVEKMTSYYSVLLHGFCKMIECEINRTVFLDFPPFRSGFAEFLEIDDNQISKDNIHHLIQQLRSHAKTGSETPRPHSMGFITESAHSTDPNRKPVFAFLQPKINGDTKRKAGHDWALKSAAVLVSIIGWFLIDAVFVVYGIRFAFIGWLGLLVAGFSALLSPLLGYFLKLRFRVVTGLILGQICGQLLFLIEFLQMEPSSAGLALLLVPVLINSVLLRRLTMRRMKQLDLDG